MKLIKYLTFLILFLIAFNGFSQKRYLKIAEEEYDTFAYLKTSEILEVVANKGHKSAELFQKLGNSFYFNNNMTEAAKWYGELMKVESSVSPEYYFRYAQALKGIDNYEEADNWMRRFYESQPNDTRGQRFAAAKDYLSEIEKVSHQFEVQNLDINSKFSDFGTTFYNNQLIFASAANKGKIYQWNEQPFLELFSAARENNQFQKGIKFTGHINTKYHESSAAFTPTGDIMFFTRNNYFKNRFKTDKKRINRLKMFRVRMKNDGKWGEPESVHFNHNDYSVAHPTINNTGDMLYFSSDMPGTMGQSDLFKVPIKKDGTLGTPVHLGSEINTEARETFPFINTRGDLFFSSDGHSGLGGLDIHVIRDFEENNTLDKSYKVKNTGKPINSAYDDFAYFENFENQEGFFSSNRPGGKGDDDIYNFYFKCAPIIAGIVKDKKTGELLSGAEVSLLDAMGELLQKQTSEENGSYNFTGLDCATNYLLRAEKPQYTGEELHVKSPPVSEELTQDLELVKDEVIITEGTNLREALELNPIYFDLDKSYIRPDASVELQKVLAVLNKYPAMHIEIKSHTDSRASKQYNEALSQRRNQSTKRYLIEKGGIDPNRLTGWGYGETQLLNQCEDGVKCTEAEHQLNRRSDFIVISM